MSAFLSSFASYLIKAIILVALAICGAKIGVSLRKSSDKKKGIDPLAETSDQE